MSARVVKDFPGRPDGEAASRTIAKGEIIEGELAEVAIANKWAVPVSEKEAAKAQAKGEEGAGEGKKREASSGSRKGREDQGDGDQGDGQGK